MKEDILNKNRLKKRRVIRTRTKVFGNATRPRLAVYKSLKNISVQAIDDSAGKTLASAKDTSLKGTRVERAREVAKEIAKALIDKKITEAIFDKRHHKYHGLIKELADAAREAGLKF